VLTDDAVSLVRLSLNALVDAAEVFPSIIKTDLHACIIHIFATILGTASCQAVVVPQSLPILKRFMTSISIPGKKGRDPQSTNLIQIQGCLKRFLSIYLNAQKRETDASLPCVKNSLLASTVLLTSGKNYMSASEPLVQRFLDEVTDCLSDRMVNTPRPMSTASANKFTDCQSSIGMHPHPPLAIPQDASRSKHISLPPPSPRRLHHQHRNRGSGKRPIISDSRSHRIRYDISRTSESRRDVSHRANFTSKSKQRRRRDI
jgi:hypothetical protein